MYCRKCGSLVDEGSAFCNCCGAAQNIDPTQMVQQPPAESMDRPMKWFKFLIYFSLWLGALSHLINGINYLTGSAYLGTAEYVYSQYEGLKTLDILMGIASLGMAAFLIYTRFRLAGFFVNGPKLLLASYGINAALQVIYALGLCMVNAAQGLSWTSVIVDVVVALSMIGLNKVYFEKRDHLFKNC